MKQKMVELIGVSGVIICSLFIVILGSIAI